MTSKIMNPQKYYAPRRHHRLHDPYNYSDKTSTDSSDDYFDQVVDEVQGVNRAGPHDSSYNGHSDSFDSSCSSSSRCTDDDDEDEDDLEEELEEAEGAGRLRGAGARTLVGDGNG